MRKSLEPCAVGRETQSPVRDGEGRSRGREGWAGREVGCGAVPELYRNPILAVVTRSEKTVL